MDLDFFDDLHRSRGDRRRRDRDDHDDHDDHDEYDRRRRVDGDPRRRDDDDDHDHDDRARQHRDRLDVRDRHDRHDDDDDDDDRRRRADDRPRRDHRGYRRAHPHVFAWALMAGGALLLGLLAVALLQATGLMAPLADLYFSATTAILPASWHDEWMAIPGAGHAIIAVVAVAVVAGLAGEALEIFD